MAGCDDLQRQCLDLLGQLKSNQATLRQSLTGSTQQSSLHNNLQSQGMKDDKPEYARQKLTSIMKAGGKSSAVENGSAMDCVSVLQRVDKDGADQNERPRLLQGQAERAKWDKRESSKLAQGEQDFDLMQEYFESRTSNSHMDSFLGAVLTEKDRQPVAKPVTPNSACRRRIIDQNVRVNSRLTDAEMDDLALGGRNLNFSYSQMLEDDDALVRLAGEDAGDRNQNAVADEGIDSYSVERETDEVGEGGLQYHQTLEDRGNNRQLNTFVRNTTIKPKTALNATQPYCTSFTKQNTTSSNSSASSSLFRSQAKDRRLLGYDWIAALIHNDTGLMDESESYFRELREFRRSNRDECCNDFYMEGPFTMSETEPVAVEKALKDSKVQPYTVNERLFTVPITENLLGQPLDQNKENKLAAEPSHEEPRFVRVSIPRSTLQMPYKVRPHRRKSFDASDSCSLSDHCLKGWNAVSPAMLPTAKSIALSDAVSGVNPHHATTMAEAEKVAATFHWPLLTEPRPQPDPMPTWRRQYMDTTLNFPQPAGSASLSLSSSLGGPGPTGSGLRQKTDDLLKSTYSMMYEMHKAREQRERDRKMQAGRAAS